MPATVTQSYKYQLVQARLGRDLSSWLTAASKERSLREMARDLSALTGIEVSYEAVRKWLVLHADAA